MSHEKVKLKDVAKYTNDKVNVDKILTENYVSTENMLENKKGIRIAESLPPSKTVNEFKENDILVSNIRPYFKKIWFANFDGGCSADVLAIRVNKEKILPEYLYYVLFQDRFFNYVMVGAKGVKMPRGDKRFIMNYQFTLPDLKTQELILRNISPITYKIDSNLKLILTLEEFNQILFHKWFVEFNFPNKEGKSYKDNNGKIQNLEGKLLPSGWSFEKLGNLTDVNTGKKDANHSTSDGQYPFYTCSSEQLNSPTYSFDTKAMILAGNGEFWFNRYEGKFEAYQRNYIIESKSDKMFDYLYLNLDKYLNIITSKSAGSIIKYLTMGMITELEVIIPNDMTLRKFNEIVNPIFKEIDSLKKENIQLEDMRDLLIHKSV